MECQAEGERRKWIENSKYEVNQHTRAHTLTNTFSQSQQFYHYAGEITFTNDIT